MPHVTKTPIGRTALVFASALTFASALALSACTQRDAAKSPPADTTPVAATGGGMRTTACPGDNGGLTLPPGFCATVFADSLGHPRHLVVASNGDIYVNTWSGSYYQDKPTPGKGFVVLLRDTARASRANVITRFGGMPEAGAHGGTGIALHAGALYVEEGATIVRYTLSPTPGAAPSSPTVTLSGMPLGGDHPMHPFAIDSAGQMFIDMGSASNSCQVKNRSLESPGHAPCTELETRGGIWKYDANKTGQTYSPKERYATGIRNAVGIAIDGTGQLYSTQHGRDQLFENWPKLYNADQGQNLPAEELLKVQQGADYGWPFCYFDNAQQKLVLAPEYGGDGGKKVGQCAGKTAPAAFFPAHWAPDGLLFYTGTAFPAHYRGGAFIAFHGSWNRAPGPQGGYQVAFVPFANGAPSAGADKYETFANGFAGGKMQPDQADHRPVGLAQGPDGALYIADDKGGRVWRVTYAGTDAPH